MLLSGAFYSIQNLNESYRFLFYLNPIFHMVNVFRYYFSGDMDFNIDVSLIICVSLFFITTFILIRVFKIGYKILK